MGTYIRQDQIAEKLEIARTMGLVTRFSVSPTGSPRRPDATVRVWRSAQTNDDALKSYLVRLLHGLVPDHLIVVAQPYTSQIAGSPGKNQEAAFEEAEPVSVAA